MMVHLESLNHSEIKLFLSSFDTILSDCDGVLWTISTPMPGVKPSLNKLKELGKEIRFITNNSSYRREDLCKKIENCYSYVQPEDIVFPTIPIIHYLKKIGFNKEIFSLGFTAMNEEFIKAGFKLAQFPRSQILDFKSCTNYFQDNKEVGAVILDFHINLSFAHLQSAIVYLQRPDVLFITGITDKVAIMGPTLIIPAMGGFIDVLEEFTGRKAMGFGKPSVHLNNMLVEKYNIKDPSRVLFIGDALEADMEFASNCGYKKLLVFSGITKPEDVKSCKNKKSIPDYCIGSLSDLYNLIAKVEV